MSQTTLNIYEEDLNEETVCDLSSKDLSAVPEIRNKCLSGLYLQNNKMTALPDDLFYSLPNLMYLDVRNNQLTDIPISIKHCQSLTHLLLQNNKITSLPNELGTISHLKVLHLGGNPLMYPPREVVNAGITKIMEFLYGKFLDQILSCDVSDTVSVLNETESTLNQEAVSYNSVIDESKLKNNETLCVQVNEKESVDSEEEYYSKNKGKCPKLAKSRVTVPSYYQSSKYPKPVKADSAVVHAEKIKQRYLKDLAIKKHKDLLTMREKILQGRKNLELLKNWRKDYQCKKFTVDGAYKMDPKGFPYDTHPDYLMLLTREDIEKDLPDKYKKKLIRRCRPTVPRKSNNDMHLALKIKQLFENLEAIDLNKRDVTPRTEQKMLLNEIQKITEIKQKLMELSTTNINSVASD